MGNTACGRGGNKPEEDDINEKNATWKRDKAAKEEARRAKLVCFICSLNGHEASECPLITRSGIKGTKAPVGGTVVGDNDEYFNDLEEIQRQQEREREQAEVLSRVWLRYQVRTYLTALSAVFAGAEDDAPMFGRDREWPKAPRRLAHAEVWLKRMHLVWWARRKIETIDKRDVKAIRTKVRAIELLNRPWHCSRRWVHDYVNVPENKRRQQFVKIVNNLIETHNDHKVYYADTVSKMNLKGKVQTRVLVLTDLALYWFDNSRSYKFRKSIPLDAIENIALPTSPVSVCVVHTRPPHRDVVLDLFSLSGEERLSEFVIQFAAAIKDSGAVMRLEIDDRSDILSFNNSRDEVDPGVECVLHVQINPKPTKKGEYVFKKTGMVDEFVCLYNEFEVPEEGWCHTKITRVPPPPAFPDAAFILPKRKYVAFAHELSAAEMVSRGRDSSSALSDTRSESGAGTGKDAKRICAACGIAGHRSRDCPLMSDRGGGKRKERGGSTVRFFSNLMLSQNADLAEVNAQTAAANTIRFYYRVHVQRKRLACNKIGVAYVRYRAREHVDSMLEAVADAMDFPTQYKQSVRFPRPWERFFSTHLWLVEHHDIWWARPRVLSLTPEVELAVRRKVICMDVMGDDGKLWDTMREFKGVYFSPEEDKKVYKKYEAAIANLFEIYDDREVLFASMVRKVNPKGKLQDRAVILTDRNIYKFDMSPKTPKIKKSGTPLHCIKSIEASTQEDGFVVLKMEPPIRDLVIDLNTLSREERAPEFITCVYAATLPLTHGKGIPVKFDDNLYFNNSREAKRQGTMAMIICQPNPKAGKPGTTAWKKSKGSSHEYLALHTPLTSTAAEARRARRYSYVSAASSWQSDESDVESVAASEFEEFGVVVRKGEEPDEDDLAGAGLGVSRSGSVFGRPGPPRRYGDGGNVGGGGADSGGDSGYSSTHSYSDGGYSDESVGQDRAPGRRGGSPSSPNSQGSSASASAPGSAPRRRTTTVDDTHLTPKGETPNSSKNNAFLLGMGAGGIAALAAGGTLAAANSNGTNNKGKGAAAGSDTKLEVDTSGGGDLISSRSRRSVTAASVSDARSSVVGRPLRPQSKVRVNGKAVCGACRKPGHAAQDCYKIDVKPASVLSTCGGVGGGGSGGRRSSAGSNLSRIRDGLLTNNSSYKHSSMLSLASFEERDDSAERKAAANVIRFYYHLHLRRRSAAVAAIEGLMVRREARAYIGEILSALVLVTREGGSPAAVVADLELPVAPERFTDAGAELAYLWRKLQVLQIRSVDRAAIEAKALAFDVYDKGWDVGTPWEGDYLGSFRTNSKGAAKFRSALLKEFPEQSVLYSGLVGEVNPKGKIQERGLVITSDSIIKLDPKSYKSKGAIPLAAVNEVCLSSRPDSFVIIAMLPPQRDLVIDVGSPEGGFNRVPEVIVALHRAFVASRGEPLPVEYSDTMYFNNSREANKDGVDCTVTVMPNPASGPGVPTEWQKTEGANEYLILYNEADTRARVGTNHRTASQVAADDYRHNTVLYTAGSDTDGGGNAPRTRASMRKVTTEELRRARRGANTPRKESVKAADIDTDTDGESESVPVGGLGLPKPKVETKDGLSRTWAGADASREWEKSDGGAGEGATPKGRFPPAVEAAVSTPKIMVGSDTAEFSETDSYSAVQYSDDYDVEFGEVERKTTETIEFVSANAIVDQYKLSRKAGSGAKTNTRAAAAAAAAKRRGKKSNDAKAANGVGGGGSGGGGMNGGGQDSGSGDLSGGAVGASNGTTKPTQATVARLGDLRNGSDARSSVGGSSNRVASAQVGYAVDPEFDARMAVFRISTAYINSRARRTLRNLAAAHAQRAARGDLATFLSPLPCDFGRFAETVLWLSERRLLWWARIKVFSLGVRGADDMRTKLLCCEIWRRPFSLSRTWVSDYLNSDSNPKRDRYNLAVLDLFPTSDDSKVLYSDLVRKVNPKGKVQDRALIVTDRAIYKCDPKKYDIKKTGTPLDVLTGISVSPRVGVEWVVLHAQPPARDLVVDVGSLAREERAPEFVSRVVSAVRALGGNLPVDFVDMITFNNAREENKLGIESSIITMPYHRKLPPYVTEWKKNKTAGEYIVLYNKESSAEAAARSDSGASSQISTRPLSMRSYRSGMFGDDGDDDDDDDGVSVAGTEFETGGVVRESTKEKLSGRRDGAADSNAGLSNSAKSLESSLQMPEGSGDGGGGTKDSPRTKTAYVAVSETESSVYVAKNKPVIRESLAEKQNRDSSAPSLLAESESGGRDQSVEVFGTAENENTAAGAPSSGGVVGLPPLASNVRPATRVRDDDEVSIASTVIDPKTEATRAALALQRKNEQEKASTVITRHARQWVRAHYFEKLCAFYADLKHWDDYGKSKRMPTPPPSAAAAQPLLEKLFAHWWAYMIVSQLDAREEAAVRMKVVTLDHYHKPWNSARSYEGDYLDVPRNGKRSAYVRTLAKIAAVEGNDDMAVLYADHMHKVNSSGKPQLRTIVLTATAIYKLDPKSYSLKKDGTPLSAVTGVTLSTRTDGWVVVHCEAPVRDLVLDANSHAGEERLSEFVTRLLLAVRDTRGGDPANDMPINVADEFEFNNSRDEKGDGTVCSVAVSAATKPSPDIYASAWTSGKGKNAYVIRYNPTAASSLAVHVMNTRRARRNTEAELEKEAEEEEAWDLVLNGTAAAAAEPASPGRRMSVHEKRASKRKAAARRIHRSNSRSSLHSDDEGESPKSPHAPEISSPLANGGGGSGGGDGGVVAAEPEGVALAAAFAPLPAVSDGEGPTPTDVTDDKKESDKHAEPATTTMSSESGTADTAVTAAAPTPTDNNKGVETKPRSDTADQLSAAIGAIALESNPFLNGTSDAIAQPTKDNTNNSANNTTAAAVASGGGGSESEGSRAASQKEDANRPRTDTADQLSAAIGAIAVESNPFMNGTSDAVQAQQQQQQQQQGQKSATTNTNTNNTNTNTTNGAVGGSGSGSDANRPRTDTADQLTAAIGAISIESNPFLNGTADSVAKPVEEGSGGGGSAVSKTSAATESEGGGDRNRANTADQLSAAIGAIALESNPFLNGTSDAATAEKSAPPTQESGGSESQTTQPTVVSAAKGESESELAAEATVESEPAPTPTPEPEPEPVVEAPVSILERDMTVPEMEAGEKISLAILRYFGRKHLAGVLHAFTAAARESAPRYPFVIEFPPALPRFSVVDEFLGRMRPVWWARCTVLGLSADDRMAVKQKALCLEIFRRPWDVARPFTGDYLSTGARADKWESVRGTLCPADGSIYYADEVVKINNKGKAQRRAVVVTDDTIYNLDPKSFAIKKGVPIASVVSLAVADRYNVDFCVVRVEPPLRDLVLDLAPDKGTERAAEFCTAVYLAALSQGCGGVEIEVSNRLTFNNSREEGKPGVESAIVIEADPEPKRGPKAPRSTFSSKKKGDWAVLYDPAVERRRAATVTTFSTPPPQVVTRCSVSVRGDRAMTDRHMASGSGKAKDPRAAAAAAARRVATKKRLGTGLSSGGGSGARLSLPAAGGEGGGAAGTNTKDDKGKSAVGAGGESGSTSTPAATPTTTTTTSTDGESNNNATTTPAEVTEETRVSAANTIAHAYLRHKLRCYLRRVALDAGEWPNHLTAPSPKVVTLPAPPFPRFEAGVRLLEAKGRNWRAIRVANGIPMDQYIELRRKVVCVDFYQKPWNPARPWTSNYLADDSAGGGSKKQAEYRALIEELCGPNSPDNKILFADTVNKVNPKGKVQPRCVIVTDLAVYKLDPKKLSVLKDATPLESVRSIGLSTLLDNFVIVRFAPPHRDLVIEVGPQGEEHVSEFVTALVMDVASLQGGESVPVTFSDRLNFNNSREEGKPGIEATLRVSLNPKASGDGKVLFEKGKKNEFNLLVGIRE